jgi:D-proline reductase (dithiol) PrdB
MTHSSVNFDRTGFQEDLNIVFPIDRFKELEDEGFIGSLASINYSFMEQAFFQMHMRSQLDHLQKF